jgi:hypothetical protein
MPNRGNGQTERLAGTTVALSGASGQLGRFLRPALLERGIALATGRRWLARRSAMSRS